VDPAVPGAVDDRLSRVHEFLTNLTNLTLRHCSTLRPASSDGTVRRTNRPTRRINEGAANFGEE